MTTETVQLAPADYLRLLSIEIGSDHEIIPPSPWLTIALIENGASKEAIEESRKEQLYLVSTHIVGHFAADRIFESLAYDLWNKGEIFRFTIPMELAGEPRTYDWRVSEVHRDRLVPQCKLTCVTQGGPID